MGFMSNFVDFVKGFTKNDHQPKAKAANPTVKADTVAMKTPLPQIEKPQANPDMPTIRVTMPQAKPQVSRLASRVQVIPSSIDPHVLGPVLANNFYACVNIPGYAGAIRISGSRILASRSRYQAVANSTGVPWWMIGAIHMREADCFFNHGFLNGDPLNHKTVHVPAGRGPFASWEASAIDGLHYKGFSGKPAGYWTLGQCLYSMEAYNGFGYSIGGGQRTVPARTSPYLWSMTTAYQSGKYESDGHFSTSRRDTQVGCVAAMKWLESQGIKIA